MMIKKIDLDEQNITLGYIFKFISKSIHFKNYSKVSTLGSQVGLRRKTVMFQTKLS